jgi:hypothetical protein
MIRRHWSLEWAFLLAGAAGGFTIAEVLALDPRLLGYYALGALILSAFSMYRWLRRIRRPDAPPTDTEATR